MSLSSFLLSKAKAQDVRGVDTELDELFKSKVYVAPPREIKTSKPEGVKERKRKLNDEEGEKIVRGIGKKPRKDVKAKEEAEGKDSGSDNEATSVDSQQSDNEEESDEDIGPASPDDENEEDKSFDSNQYVHESLQSKKDAGRGQKKGLKNRYVPPDETPAQRDLRTVFVGNLSVEVSKKRPLQKQLRRHLLSAVPSARVESIRFRSIAFESPTAKLSGAGDAAPNIAETPVKDGRKHDRARAAAWRQSQDEKEGQDEKKFLTPNQKKKIAFINHKFHPVADTVHAYVVFAHPVHPLSSTEHKPHREVMNPYEAAQAAARQCDGTMFMDRLLRVDVVGKSSVVESGADPKLTIFVGNLDFGSKEEDLRVFFEGVISKERGEPPPHLHEDGEGDEEDGGVKKARTWVTRVRIVRDRETQLGKGFAYIQFMDRECVDEILALEEGGLKFARRKLRVQRCKTIPGSSVSTSASKSQTKKSKIQSESTYQVPPPSNKKSAQHGQPPSVNPPTPIVVPKGNPKLGEKLAHLSKEERKQAKAVDADRVARRLAKKKARMAMGTKDKDQASLEGKKRVRARQSAKDKIAVKNGKSSKAKEKKGRVRSERSLAKLNTKK